TKPECIRATDWRPPSAGNAGPTLSSSTPSKRELAVSSGNRALFDGQLDPSHSQPISARQRGVFNAPVVHEGSVGARQVDDLHGAVAGGQATVQTGDQRGVYDEIGSWGAAHGLDGAWRESKCEGVVIEFGALQDPHVTVS